MNDKFDTADLGHTQTDKRYHQFHRYYNKNLRSQHQRNNIQLEHNNLENALIYFIMLRID